MRSIALFAAVLEAAFAFAAVKPGENLLLNGSLEADQADFPPFWNAGNGVKDSVKWNPDGGPDGLPYLSFRAGRTPDVRVKQYGLDLVPDGRYRISMQARTKNFRSGSHTGILLVNSGSWRSTAGVLSLPPDTTGAWQRVEREFKCFNAPDGYTAMIRVADQSGELDVADIRIEAIDGLALAKSGPSKQVACEMRPRLVPLAPKLAAIPADDPRVSFRFFGRLDGADEVYEVSMTADGSGECVHCPLSREEMRLPLSKGATNGVMAVAVAEKATGRIVAESRYNFRVVPPVPKGAYRRRLNNLAVEVLSAPLADGGTRRFPFVVSRDGWTFTAVSGRTGAAFAVRIDGREVINPSTPRHETFRRLAAGEHVLEVSGVESGGVAVREIAEILNYCPGVNSAIKENPPYDWDFNERYVLPAVTTQLGGSVPKERRAEFRARGYEWMNNINLTGGETAGMIAKLASCDGMVKPEYDGVACDEQNYSDIAAIDAYAAGMWAYDLEKNPSRPVHTWAYGGKPPSGAVSLDFLSACMNVSGGRGMLLRELYCSTRETEDAERLYLRSRIGDVMDAYRAMDAGAMGSIGVVLGNFNQTPILTLVHHPEVDYKYALDMQMNFAANDPSCRGIGLVGYWGSYYADEEMHRWSFALMRHYVVEGRTDMLSVAHGFRYRPDHVLNGDFRGTLAPWRAKGCVRLDEHANFATRSQNRWGGNGGTGDTFAVLVRGEGEASSLSQTVKGLVPGRKYCLQFATFDVKDVKADRIAPRRFGIDATLSDGAEVDESLSWLHVDERIKGRYAANNGVARINLHHIVFTARAPETELVLDNSAARPGEELGVNCLSLLPYFGLKSGTIANGDISF